MTPAVVKRTIRASMARSYPFARAVGMSQRIYAARGATEPPVVIHQMGKVGSTSVRDGIAQACPGRTVYQIHHLTQSALHDEEALYRSVYSERRRIDGHLLDGLFVRSQLDRNRLPSGTVVISMVRDPMAQLLSAFFQTMPFRMPGFDEAARERPAEAFAEELAHQFVGQGWWNDNRIRQFFRTQFQPVWGVDVFSLERDQSNGTFRTMVGARSFVIVRFEDLADRARTVLGDSVGVSDLPLPRRQVSADKTYGPLVALVRRSALVDDAYLDRAYESPEVRFFYSDDEIDLFRERWRS